MRTIWQSLVWKEWHEHKWKLVSLTAILWSIAVSGLFHLERGSLIGIHVALVMAIIPLAIFIGLMFAPIALLLPLPIKIVVDSAIGGAPLPGPLADWMPGLSVDSALALDLHAEGAVRREHIGELDHLGLLRDERTYRVLQRWLQLSSIGT